MARRIIKKLGGDRIGSGNKMTVTAHGYGFSTHDVSKVRRTSMSFGTIVPMGQFLLTTGSRLRIRLDALITSNALLYQLYGSAKFQIDVYSARMALYNPKMLLNLNDQGYDISDIKFPLMELETQGLRSEENVSNQQINPSALLRYLGIAGNGQNETHHSNAVTRQHNAMWLLMYYQTVKEYYTNRQEASAYMIHNEPITPVEDVEEVWIRVGTAAAQVIPEYVNQDSGISYNFAVGITAIIGLVNGTINVGVSPDDVVLVTIQQGRVLLSSLMSTWVYEPANNLNLGSTNYYVGPLTILGWAYRNNTDTPVIPRIGLYDPKEIDKMMMKIMSEVETPTAMIIDKNTPYPYGASFRNNNGFYSVNSSQEGLCLGTYQSDVFNNWLNNATINTLNAKNKVKVNAEGEFSIDMLNIIQKMYNQDQRIGATDGTLDEWREMTYGQVSKSKSLKPVYEGGLSKEIVFDMIVSTANTTAGELGSIASRGTFGNKHKGGYVQIDTDEEKMVMVLAKITPRLVYNQGNDWTTNLKTLEDLHKPALDKIGYQNLLTDQMAAFDTIVKNDGTLTTFTAGKQPAWQWYRTNYDDALGNMAETEDYKVFGRQYEAFDNGDHYKIRDLTTYIDPQKFNDVFALKSLDAMNFDVQVGMDATLTLVMSEEVIPNL